MDQLLGRAGRTFNGEAAAVAAGAQSPEQATGRSGCRNRVCL
jgi:hypothetical protein